KRDGKTQKNRTKLKKVVQEWKTGQSIPHMEKEITQSVESPPTPVTSTSDWKHTSPMGKMDHSCE
ncbi:hypothetical protein HAX54_046017, partial [Datura stramonium]|nr:hypothetical protein [Datura stramonium]